jgi:branched-chain amino acid transport system substrate-binding protein
VWHAPGFTIQESYRYAGEASAYLFSQGLWSSDLPYPGAGNYYDKFFEIFGSAPDYHGAQAYAAMNVIADALKRSKSLTPKDVREALANTDMMTVFGLVKFISYGKKTQQNMLPTLLLQRLQENFRVVWPKNIASKKYVFPVPGWKERH